MADILNLGEIPNSSRVKSCDEVGRVLGGADIIFFPGVRYERYAEPPEDMSGQEITPNESPEPN